MSWFAPSSLFMRLLFWSSHVKPFQDGLKSSLSFGISHNQYIFYSILLTAFLIIFASFLLHFTLSYSCLFFFFSCQEQNRRIGCFKWLCLLYGTPHANRLPTSSFPWCLAGEGVRQHKVGLEQHQYSWDTLSNHSALCKFTQYVWLSPMTGYCQWVGQPIR